ncbi:MAG: response regulator transcription factor [Balneolaceae bacterium]
MIYNETNTPAHKGTDSVKRSGRHFLPAVFLENNLRNGPPDMIYTQENNPKAIHMNFIKGVNFYSIVSEPPDDFSGLTDTSEASQPQQTEQNEKITVLLADDHRMMREGLRKIIEEEKDLLIIGEAADGEEAIKMALDISPDVIVMDVNMPGMSGIQATRKIISENKNARIIGLSLYDNQDVAQSMKSAGASAYLTKTDAIETLCTTIRNEAKIKGNNTD